MAAVSIVTPWYNCPELIRTYERSHLGAEVVIVDNGSDAEAAGDIYAMAVRMGGLYVRNEHNAKFAEANNQGAQIATSDIVAFMNNDTEAPPGWVNLMATEVKPGALYGPSKQERMIAGRLLPYIEGYCIAATRDTWERVGWWDAETFTGMYWEDNDLCYRAIQLGIGLRETNWPVWHRGNYTSSHTAGSYDNSATNLAVFEQRVSQRHAP